MQELNRCRDLEASSRRLCSVVALGHADKAGDTTFRVVPGLPPASGECARQRHCCVFNLAAGLYFDNETIKSKIKIKIKKSTEEVNVVE